MNEAKPGNVGYVGGIGQSIYVRPGWQHSDGWG
jgi:hypothetical protein